MEWCSSPTPADEGHDGEGRHDDRRVGDHVEERGGGTTDGAGPDTEQDEAGVVDRRVGEHALDVALDQRDAGADHAS